MKQQPINFVKVNEATINIVATFSKQEIISLSQKSDRKRNKRNII